MTLETKSKEELVLNPGSPGSLKLKRRNSTPQDCGYHTTYAEFKNCPPHD